MLDDLAEVSALELRDLLTRCSQRTLQTRFHHAGPTIDQLADVLARTGTLVGLAARIGTTVVGVGSVDPPAPHELAILVEDRWQRHGVGRRLLTALASRAAATGVTALAIAATVDNIAARRLVLAQWPGARFSSPDSGVIETVIPLRPNRSTVSIEDSN